MLKRIGAVKTIMFVNLVVAVSVVMGLMAFTDYINRIPVALEARIPLLFAAVVLYAVVFAFVYEPILYGLGRLFKCLGEKETEESVTIRPVSGKPGREGLLCVDCDGTQIYKFYTNKSEYSVPAFALVRDESNEISKPMLVIKRATFFSKGVFKLFYSSQPMRLEFVLLTPQQEALTSSDSVARLSENAAPETKTDEPAESENAQETA